MGQISLPEVDGLLKKFFEEQTPLIAFFFSPSGARVKLPSFVAGATREAGLFLTPFGRSNTEANAYINVRPFDRECEFWYGEVREMPEEERARFAETYGESVLLFRFLESGEAFALYFTV